jgi:hypothetical protein
MSVGVHEMRRKLSLAVLALSLLNCAGRIYGQSANATITGIVQDPQGSSIAQGQIVAVQSDTGLSRQTTSGESGEYTIPDLPIGSYKVTVTAAGFKTSIVPNLVLQVNQTAQLNFKLELGAVSEQISVTAATPLLTTESSSVGTVVENRSIESLALNGRQFWQLVALVPGASYTPGGQGTRTGGGSIRSSSVNVQINGTGFIYNGWLLDGVDITEYEQGGTNFHPNVFALNELKVESANMPAE